MTTSISQFPRGDSHPKYNGGRIVNEHGYVRVSTGRTNMKYEHRAVIEGLMLEQAVMGIVEGVMAGNLVLDPGDPWESGYVELPTQQTIAREIMAVLANPPTIPAGVHIHHTDHDKQHNCPCNLQVLDVVIHNAITQSHRRFVRRMEREQLMERLRDAG